MALAGSKFYFGSVVLVYCSALLWHSFLHCFKLGFHIALVRVCVYLGFALALHSLALVMLAICRIFASVLRICVLGWLVCLLNWLLICWLVQWFGVRFVGSRLVSFLFV